MHIALMHTSFLAVPGVPQNLESTVVSEFQSSCIILVTWSPPTNSDGSDIDHYIVYVPSRNIMENETSVISVLRLPNCRDDVRIQVAAVNQFDCVGLKSEILLNMFNNIPTTEGLFTTNTPNEFASTPTEDGPTSVPSKLHVIVDTWV